MIVRVMSYIDSLIVKLFGNAVMQRHGRSHGAHDVSVVAPRGSASGCVQSLSPYLTAYVENHMQQITLCISSEKIRRAI